MQNPTQNPASEQPNVNSSQNQTPTTTEAQQVSQQPPDALALLQQAKDAAAKEIEDKRKQIEDHRWKIEELERQIWDLQSAIGVQPQAQPKGQPKKYLQLGGLPTTQPQAQPSDQTTQQHRATPQQVYQYLRQRGNRGARSGEIKQVLGDPYLSSGQALVQWMQRGGYTIRMQGQAVNARYVAMG